MLTGTSAADAAYDDRGCGSARHVTSNKRGLQAAGFTIEMRYLTLASFAMHFERVKTRAIEETNELWIYDNTTLRGPPQLVMEANAGRIMFLSDPPPARLAGAFGW